MHTIGFGNRLRLAMASGGGISAVELARRCGVSRQTVNKWLAMTEADLAGKHLLKASEVLNVRSRWLGSGYGPIAKPTEDAEQAIAVIWSMTNAAARQRWIATGKRMLDESGELIPPIPPRPAAAGS